MYTYKFSKHCSKILFIIQEVLFFKYYLSKLKLSQLANIFLRYLWRNRHIYMVQIRRIKYWMTINWPALEIYNYWVIWGQIVLPLLGLTCSLLLSECSFKWMFRPLPVTHIQILTVRSHKNTNTISLISLEK